MRAGRLPRWGWILLLAMAAQAGAGDFATLRAELEAMRDADQLLRTEIRVSTDRLGPDAPAVNALWVRQRALDRQNFTRLQEIVAQSGWPRRSAVGEKAASGAFLVVQHADLAAQQQMLPLLRAEAARGEVKPSALALLEDRVRVGQGQPQIYGSQLMRDPATGTMAFSPIADEVNVDARRKSVGLEPIADYAKRFGLDYVAPATNKAPPTSR